MQYYLTNMIFTKFFVISLLNGCFEITCYILRRPCNLFGDFSIQQNKYMNTSVILNISIIEYDDCIIRCILTTNCTSINHETNTKFCELLDQYLGIPGNRSGWKFYTTSYLDPLNIGSYCVANKPCGITQRCMDACIPQKYQCIQLLNIAPGSIATISSVLSGWNAYASNCIDSNHGDVHGHWCHTNLETYPWFRLDLRRSYRIAVIRISTRTGILWRIRNFNIFIGNSVTSSKNDLFVRTNQPYRTTTYKNFAKIFQGRYISLHDTNGGWEYLDFTEIEIFGIKSSEFNNL